MRAIFAICGAIALAASAAVPAWSDEATPPAQTTAGQANNQVASEPAPGSPEEVICRKEEAATGTMLGRKKICKTRKEWDQLARDSQEALRQSQEHGLRTNPVPDAGGN